MKILVNWVDALERLPREEGLYIVIYKMQRELTSFEEISVARFRHGTFRIRCQHSYKGAVTHWLEDLKMPS